ncbi:hypothetical protein L0F51_00080 [Afifella sp. H1R]|uniref:hypothetical protein n=1 Tax=Afifella sp. H1R TaxID=2908841 RepID=UPI001F38DFE2|nr:hypothetical protein [Afifella sp. H1R]MCF1502163.1 hypothetical protein [Afifella sp. H1R]
MADRTKEAEIEKLRIATRQLQAELTSMARTMRHAEVVVGSTVQTLEDEGDRVYFASTNQADQLRDLHLEMDEWEWHMIRRHAGKEDVYAACRMANDKLRSAQCDIASLRDRAERAEEALRFYADIASWTQLTIEQQRAKQRSTGDGADVTTAVRCGDYVREAPAGYALSAADKDAGDKARAVLKEAGNV